MIYQTRAIVLRTVKYGESSLITDMYTEQKGHQTFIINSVRKAKAITPPSYLQLLTLVDMIAYHQDYKKINRIKEVRLDYTYQSIPFDMRKSSVITCLADIMSRCLATSYPQPDLFSFIHEQLIEYDKSYHFDRDFMIRFLVGLTPFLGFGLELNTDQPNMKYFDLQEGHATEQPPLHNYVVSIEEINHLSLIVSGRKESYDLSLSTRRKLIDLLITYYQLHVETLREVKSLKILRELF